jgi:Fe-S-cluster containining protein
MKPISETRQKINRVQQAKHLVRATQSLDEVYVLLNQLSSDVLDMYPHIACRSMCNTCCKGNSMPTVSAAEWERVHQYLLQYYTAAQRTALIARTREMYNPRKALYWAVHDTIQQDPTPEKLAAFAEILPQLMETQCPMLVDEKCSVYLSRPAKCRAHGTFLFVLPPHVQFHACESEIEKMETFLQEQGSRQVVMPVWNDFEIKINSDFNPPEAISTILPIWLLTHTQQGELRPDTVLTPNFEHFRLQDL